jgi:hypothetical protein
MPGGGQVNQIVWDAGRHRALLSAYTAAAVTEYDPSRPVKWPENPRVVASAAHEHQMRPRALAFDRRHVWMATGASYGLLGGALSRIDPETGEIKVWRNIVPDQTINSIVLDSKRRRVYISSDISADCDSCAPTQTTAQVVSFDMDRLQVLRRQVVREGAWRLGLNCLLHDGRVLLHEKNRFYAWGADAGIVEDLGTLASAGGVVSDQHGVLWGSIGGAIGRVDIAAGAIHFTPVIHHQGGYLQIDDDVLYYALDTTIYATPLDELRGQLTA